MPVVASNICSVVALGADDYSVSIWQTKSARPLIVAKDCFERQIMDLSWEDLNFNYNYINRVMGTNTPLNIEYVSKLKKEK